MSPSIKSPRWSVCWPGASTTSARGIQPERSARTILMPSLSTALCRNSNRVTAWSFASARIGPPSSLRNEPGAKSGRSENPNSDSSRIPTTGSKTDSKYHSIELQLNNRTTTTLLDPPCAFKSSVKEGMRKIEYNTREKDVRILLTIFLSNLHKCYPCTYIYLKKI